MIGWLIGFGLLTGFLTLKVGVRLRWESGSAVLLLRIGPVRFSLSAKKKPKAKGERNGTPSGSRPTEKKWYRAVLIYWRELLELTGRILRTPQVELLRLHIAVGGTDAEACAMRYGHICAGLSGALPLVYRIFQIAKQDIDVSCQFEQPETKVLAEAEITVKIYEVFALAGVALGLLIKLYSDTKIKKKAVQPE